MQIKYRLDFLDSMRGLMIAMVVAVHALAYSNTSVAFASFVKVVCLTIAVPIFFFADGYLLSFKYSKTSLNYSNFMKKSVVRLLLPWLSFSIIYITLRFILEYFGFFNEHVVYGIGFAKFFRIIYLSSVANQMYFLLSLFLIRLGANVWTFILHQVWGWYFFLGGILLISSLDILYIPDTPFEPILIAIKGIQFYFLGILFHKSQRFIEDWKNIAPVFWGVLAISFFFIKTGNPWFASTFRFSYILAVCSFFFRMSNIRLLSVLGKSSMGIFLIHQPVVINVLSKIISRSCDNYHFIFWLVTLLTIITSYILTTLIHKAPFRNVRLFLLGES